MGRPGGCDAQLRRMACAVGGDSGRARLVPGRDRGHGSGSMQITPKRENRKWDPYGISFLYFLNRPHKTHQCRQKNCMRPCAGLTMGNRKKGVCTYINIYLEERYGEAVESTKGGSYATK